MIARFSQLVTACLALALLSGCFWRRPEIEVKEVPLGYRGEARVKPFLAATRFLEAMGLPVEDCYSLAKLPDTTVAMLLPAEADRTPSSAQRLLGWVHQGGHAVYLLQGGDSFLNDFAEDALWGDEEEPKEKKETDKEKRKEKAPSPAGKPSETGSPPKPGKDPKTDPSDAPESESANDPESPAKHRYPFLECLPAEVVDRPENVAGLKLRGKNWKVEIPPSQGFKVLPEVAGSVQVYSAGPSGREAFLSFPLGSGRVTLVADAKLWRNRYIGEKDHAALLWEVMQLCPATAQVWVVRSTKVSLFELIWEYGRMPVISFAVFLLAWLWWATRKFGPPLPDPDGNSREFSHHLDMSGSFLWRLKAVATLVDPARRRIRSRHGLQEGGHAPGSECLAKLVRQSGLDEPALQRALWGEIPREPRKFLELITRLQLLDSLK